MTELHLSFLDYFLFLSHIKTCDNVKQLNTVRLLPIRPWTSQYKYQQTIAKAIFFLMDT